MPPENNPNPKQLIDTLNLKKGCLVIRAINHPLRQKMLKLLHHHNQMAVSDLYTKLGLEQSFVSQHLSILRRAGFVQTTKKAKYVYYSVHYERLREVQELAGQLLT